MTASPSVTAANAPGEAESASWLHNVVAWIERLPGPTWVAHLTLFILNTLFWHQIPWLQGQVPVGTFDPASAFWGFLAPALLWIAGHLERAAASAFDAFRPALTMPPPEAERLADVALVRRHAARVHFRDPLADGALPRPAGPQPPVLTEPVHPLRQRLEPGAGAIAVVPANEASWEDLRSVFGDRGYPAYCQCQKFKFGSWAERRATTVADRMERLQEQTQCGDPGAPTTSGLVAYLDGEPVGWCAVEPRTEFVRLRRTPVTFKDRYEDPDDDGVWAVVCFATRAGFRRRGISRALARATVDFARERGARAIEGYPMLTEPGQEVTWGEMNVGSRSIFADAGYQEVAHPTLRRVVMRIDF